MNEFMKNSETNSNNSDLWKSNKSCEPLTESSTKYDPVMDGISILKSLILDKISVKQEENSNKSHFQSTYNPKVESLSAPLPLKKRRRKKIKVKSKVSWKNAETLIPCQYISSSAKNINTDKLYKSMMKEWQDKETFKQLAQSSTKSINFNQNVKADMLSAKGMLPDLPKRFKKMKKLKLVTKDLKASTFNSEKFIIEMQKKKEFERLDKLRSESLTRPVKRFAPITTNTLKGRRDTNAGFLKPLQPSKRVKILTPLCLNTSNSSSLSVSVCSERES